jgi:hypothetical protein
MSGPFFVRSLDLKRLFLKMHENKKIFLFCYIEEQCRFN